MEVSFHFFFLSALNSQLKKSKNNFYKENNLKPCLIKQLLNVFKLWCERGKIDEGRLAVQLGYNFFDLRHFVRHSLTSSGVHL